MLPSFALLRPSRCVNQAFLQFKSRDDYWVNHDAV